MNSQDYRRTHSRLSSNSIRMSTYIIYIAIFVSFMALAMGNRFDAIFMSLVNCCFLFAACVIIAPDTVYSLKIVGMALGVNKQSLIEAKVCGIYDDVKASFLHEVYQLDWLKLGKLHVFPGAEAEGELKVTVKDREFNVIGEVLYVVGFSRRDLERKDGKKDSIHIRPLKLRQKIKYIY